MSLSRKTALVGAYEHPARFAPNKSMFQIMAEGVRGALDDAGLKIQDVDGVCTTGMGMSGMGIVGFCDYMNLTPNFVESTSIGGSSFVAQTAHAAAAIAAGLCNVCIVVYGSTAASQRFAIGTGGPGMGGDPCDQYEVPFGPTTVGAYAMMAQRHMHEYGTTSEQLAEIAVTMRLHASMNPAAKYRDPITVGDVLASRIISSPLHLLDCCIISDGGGALVVTSAERARDLAKKPVYILGCGETVRHPARGRRDFMEMAAGQSGRLAFERAGATVKDIDLAMIYDSFTITVLMTLENLGFCKRGEGGAFVSGGRLRYDGALPTNTDGGGLSSNHPGMRGIFLVIEAVKQLRREGGPRQVKDCKVALCHGTGGALGTRHSGATLILTNQ
jgi:acetyl-CoA C-acetyltransferase